MNVGTTKEDAAVIAPYLVPRYGERPGQEPRTRSLEEPAPAIVPTGNEGSIVAPVLTAYYGEGDGSTDRSSSPETPLPTDTAGGNRHAVVAAFLAQHNSERSGVKAGTDVREPTSTITSGGGQQTVVTAFMAQNNGMEPGHDARKPVSTIVSKGSTQSLVAAHMQNMRGSDRRDASVERPAPTSSAGGNHAATVYAFLAKYYGAGVPSQAVDDPLHTVTAKPRHGVVIVDIGMRMLTPRERFNAQGFPADYKIDIEVETVDRKGRKRMKKLPLDAQGRMCGNSVSPPLAAALIRANFAPRAATPTMIAAE